MKKSELLKELKFDIEHSQYDGIRQKLEKVIDKSFDEWYNAWFNDWANHIINNL